METIFTLDNFLIWFMVSIIILVLWSFIMGDPGVSNTENVIVTIICAILALPITIIVLLFLFIIQLIIEYDERRNEPDL